MKIYCEYCNSPFDDTLTECPQCGAPSKGVKRTEDKQPKTIEELKRWYVARGLPPYETTRFFIGENYQGKRAFGIYKDEKSGNCVVYKNKDDGSRAVRYEGTDEAYAVNELYMRLKQEIIEQKTNNLKKSPTPPASTASTGSGFIGNPIVRVIIIVITILFILGWIGEGCIEDDYTTDGYYQYNGNTYYQDYGRWYEYDTGDDDWVYRSSSDIPEALVNESTASDFFYTPTWDESTQITDFADSEFYSENHASDSWWSSNSDYDWSSSDSDYDWSSSDSWDSDSWDSGSSDWDSDW